MKILMMIRIIGEVEDRLYKNIIFESQITHIDLLKRVKIVTQIPIEHQQIKLHGEELPDSPRPLSAAKDYDELVVKHAHFDLWTEYLEYCKNVDDVKNTKPERTKFAHTAISFSKILEESRFLAVYVSFNAQWRESISKLMRVLELIRVGPIVYFPYYAASTHIYYIATQEVKNFKELDKLEDGFIQNRIVVEAYLLSLILGMRDLNEGNIGSTEENALSIIDFYVPDTDNFERRRILEDFKNKNNFGGIGMTNEILCRIGPEERMQIAQNALPHWSLITSISSDIIGCEKNDLRNHGIQFGPGANDVESYLQDIKANYESICAPFQ